MIQTMNKTISFLSIVLLFVSYTSGYPQESRHFLDFPANRIDLPEYRGRMVADTFLLDFNVRRDGPGGSRVRDLLDGRYDLRLLVRDMERDGVEPVEYVPGSLRQQITDHPEGGVIPDDITVSVVVDRSGSIRADEMKQMREAVEALVQALPDSSVFLSYFHNVISPSYQVSKRHFSAMADTIFQVCPDCHTDLHNAVITKLLEFFDESVVIPNEGVDREFGYERNRELFNRGSRYNYLIIVSDGMDDCGKNDIARGLLPNPKYHRLIAGRWEPIPRPGMRRFAFDEVLEYLEAHRDQVTTHVLAYLTDRGVDDVDPELLEKMARAGGGLYWDAEPGEIIQFMTTDIPDQLRNDYAARFVFSPRQSELRGQRLTWSVELLDEGDRILASGEFIHRAPGSPANPIPIGSPDPIWDQLWRGLLLGLLFFLVIVIIIQLILPMINNKLFNMKNVSRFRLGTGELKKVCPYCFDPLHEGQKVVVKCSHVVHKECWADNGYMCPEYGQNCKTGKQNHFDIQDPFSRKNKLHYLAWVIYGLLAGIVSWVLYLFSKDLPAFYAMVEGLASWLKPGMPDALAFRDKTAPLLVAGLILGFFLSLFLAWAEEYRRKTLMVLLRMLLRALLGSLAGFTAFLAGSLILMLMGVGATLIWLDWIPWLLFGLSLGLILSIRSSIHWKHGLIGGMLSVLFSFFLVYILTDVNLISVLFGFMIYGAGLAISVATVRSLAEVYFLRILNGPRQGNRIAIHKWMNSQGIHSQVYMGLDNMCEIQINWEKSQEIADKHAKVYINRSRNVPVIMSLEKGFTTMYDERIEMEPGREYDLFNNTSFRIGETVFQYEEK